MVKRIVWANDGTPSADRAIPVIKDLIASTGASLTVCHVHRDWHLGHRPVLVEDHRPIEQELRRQVDGLIAEGLDADLALTTNDGGHPAALIAELAEQEDADLIVAGSHGRGPVAGLLLGLVHQPPAQGGALPGADRAVAPTARRCGVGELIGGRPEVIHAERGSGRAGARSCGWLVGRAGRCGRGRRRGRGGRRGGSRRRGRGGRCGGGCGRGGRGGRRRRRP